MKKFTKKQLKYINDLVKQYDAAYSHAHLAHFEREEELEGDIVRLIGVLDTETQWRMDMQVELEIARGLIRAQAKMIDSCFR